MKSRDVQTKEFERLFKALANKRRLEILVYLTKKKEAMVSDIAHEIRLSFNSTSKHVVLLRHVGILEREQRSLMMFYSRVKPLLKHIEDILAVLTRSY